MSREVDTSSADKHIERFKEMRDNLHSLTGALCIYDELQQKYGETLRSLTGDLNDSLGHHLLAKHDLLNPRHLRPGAPQDK
jgi:hypothetical protein